MQKFVRIFQENLREDSNRISRKLFRQALQDFPRGSLGNLQKFFGETSGILLEISRRLFKSSPRDYPGGSSTNLLEIFQKTFQETSTRFSRKLFKSVPRDFPGDSSSNPYEILQNIFRQPPRYFLENSLDSLQETLWPTFFRFYKIILKLLPRYFRRFLSQSPRNYFSRDCSGSL